MNILGVYVKDTTGYLLLNYRDMQRRDYNPAPYPCSTVSRMASTSGNKKPWQDALHDILDKRDEDNKINEIIKKELNEALERKRNGNATRKDLFNIALNDIKNQYN